MKPLAVIAAAIAAIIAAGTTGAATLESSFENTAVSNFDLDAQGYDDWARWEGSPTATLQMDGGTIIQATVTDTVGQSDAFNTSHTFVQRTLAQADRTIAYKGSGASMTFSFDLDSGNDYTIELYSRVIPESLAANRNDVEFLASIGGASDTLTVLRSEVPLGSGTIIYTLEVTNLAASGTLTIKLTSVNQGDGRAIDMSVRAAAATVTATEGGVPFPLVITRNPDTPGTFDFEWGSRPGKLYDLLSSTDLVTPIAEWPVYDDGDMVYGGIPADGEVTTLTAVPSDDPRRFFAMLEKDAPPPPPIFSEDFETDGGGFTVIGSPNDWAWGTPNSNNNAGLVLTTGNGGSTGAWATNLGLGGTAPFGVIDPAADSILRSPDIDLTGVTGAKLSFAAAYDANSGDVIEVLVRNAATDALIATINPVTATLPASSNWTTLGPFDLSAADNTNIYLEFRYDGTDASYIGLYIDDVEVTPAP